LARCDLQVSGIRNSLPRKKLAGSQSERSRLADFRRANGQIEVFHEAE
jgi:hypothetical protein